MKHIRYILLSITLIAGGLAYGPASAALPSFAADLNEGTIDRLDVKAGEIIVDDNYFVLSSGVRVYSKTGAPVALKSLRKGMKIGFSTVEHDSKPPAVANIVILSGN